jgi:hypothetical protein
MKCQRPELWNRSKPVAMADYSNAQDVSRIADPPFAAKQKTNPALLRKRRGTLGIVRDKKEGGRLGHPPLTDVATIHQSACKADLAFVPLINSRRMIQISLQRRRHDSSINC